MSDKEKLQAEVAAETPAAQDPADATSEGAASTEPPADRPQTAHAQLPPATLTLLLTSLGTQALMSLGQIPHPATNKPEFDLEQARHCIDLLSMLEEKTANNRTNEESQLLDGMLYELRMLFVQSK